MAVVDDLTVVVVVVGSYSFAEIREKEFNVLSFFFLFIGDSGFPTQPWLMTPLTNPITEGQKLYNKSHKKGRNPIERCNGVLKTRFRCLLKERVLRYRPEKVGLIINACAVLHNILTKNRVPIPDEVIADNVEPNQNHTIHYNDNNSLREGLRGRDNLILQKFS